ncbi:MAG: hypothetical protein NZM31_13775, partial [Gemmatales bacterium]|nr:hypothetical protein [Gemmatales bacterium]MDW8388064.1 hypothetical protein [Gemmatales bacterium]
MPPRLPDLPVAIYTDLKQVLDQARPHSVLLSVEQYEALLERLQKLEKQNPDRKPFFLNACRITGQVTPAGPSRLLADVQLSLEFRTTEKDLILPLGLKGARLTKALLDGEPPVWVSGGEGLALHLREPKAYRLVLHVQPTVTPIGQEYRLLIENLPQAAITTLDLVVPSRATNAQVIGSGPIRIEATEDNRSRLRSDALGVLTQLDLRWQKEGTEGPGRQVIVQAETQAAIDESALESESRVRIEVAEGSLDQVTFGLAGEITRVQVDSEGTNDP